MRAGGRGEPYWLKQWAAESSQRSPTTVAPQKCREPSFRLACQGTSPAAAADPPTMRAGLSSAGLAPHSEGQDRREKGLDAFGQSEHLGLGGPWDTGHVLALAEPGEPPQYTDGEMEAQRYPRVSLHYVAQPGTWVEREEVAVVCPAPSA